MKKWNMKNQKLFEYIHSTPFEETWEMIENILKKLEELSKSIDEKLKELKVMLDEDI